MSSITILHAYMFELWVHSCTYSHITTTASYRSLVSMKPWVRHTGTYDPCVWRYPHASWRPQLQGIDTKCLFLVQKRPYFMKYRYSWACLKRKQYIQLMLIRRFAHHRQYPNDMHRQHVFDGFFYIFFHCADRISLWLMGWLCVDTVDTGQMALAVEFWQIWPV